MIPVNSTYATNNVSPNTSVVTSCTLYGCSRIYIRTFLGIDFHVVNHLMHIRPSQLYNTIKYLNDDNTVDGIILQLPLPLHLVEQTHSFIDSIRPDKDVDAHTSTNNHVYRQESSSSSSVMIPVVAAVRELLTEIGQPLQGKHVVVIGRSKYVGTPLALMLSQSSNHERKQIVSGATVSICHRETPANTLAWFCKHADVVISAVGRASQ
jgi:5,10-methylene-tetrahydrofolate dehydrogenase/methenyl tetrahydrofolate cyclohydrolase